MNTISEYDEFLVTMYHRDPLRFEMCCNEDEWASVAYLNKNLSEKQIAQLIENYNLRTHGISHPECKDDQ